MALKICKECNREYSDTRDTCPHCGFVDSKKVVIYGYTENFAINPDVKVYLNDRLVASVAHNSKAEIEIDGACELRFKCSIRSTRCFVNPGDAVVMAFNRTTGSLTATPTTRDNVATVINIQRGKDYTRIIWIIIICTILFLAGKCMSQRADELLYEESYYEESYYE